MTDVLDSYFHNDDPDYPNGNFAQQWALLEPFLTASASQTISQIITQICEKNGVEPLLGISVASCEGGLTNPLITRINTNGSVDRGIFQWNNKYHPEITDEMAFDPAQATQCFCDAVKQGKLVTYWSASEPNWIKLLTPDIISKYELAK